jgi:hypothetical protein
MPRLSVVDNKQDNAEERLKERLAAEENRTLLRFLTCGSVDDGKSTLIGRLLFDSAQIYEDQLKSAERDSKRPGGNGVLDLALLVDGLQAEREQKITIDVAYRYFSTPRRRFIVADTPGHMRYAQHGDRRFNYDSRIWSMRAPAYSPKRGACLHRLATRQPQARACRQQDGHRRFQSGALRRDCRRLQDLRRAARL